MEPRLIRFKDAPAYLGMNRHLFNQIVRPTIPSLKIGRQGIAFDKVDLDAWVDQYKRCGERPLKNRRTEHGTQNNNRTV